MILLIQNQIFMIKNNKNKLIYYIYKLIVINWINKLKEFNRILNICCMFYVYFIFVMWVLFGPCIFPFVFSVIFSVVYILYTFYGKKYFFFLYTTEKMTEKTNIFFRYF